jgi:sugar lactone lactonase YvrE
VNHVTQKGEVSVYCDSAPDVPLVNPNHGSFDAKADYYFSDSGDYWKPNGRFIRARPNGRSESLMGGNWHFPNGLVMSPKCGAVFMIETTTADVLRIPVNKDGMVGAPEACTQFPGNTLDGPAFAKNGNIHVSRHFPNRTYVASPDQNAELLIEDTSSEILNQPTNIAFEPEGTRLFCANLSGAHVGAFDVGETGAPLHYLKL